VSWRNDHKESFISNKKVNSDSTKSWLKKEVLENTNREIFWILNFDKDYIGHIGILFDDLNHRFELDSVLKGIQSTSGIMWLSMRHIERVIHNEFHAVQIFLKVLETNVTAINFYRRNGYKEIASSEGFEELDEPRGLIVMAKEIDFESPGT
jgi:RimJ/RimL family protein N-acetyltransferase